MSLNPFETIKNYSEMLNKITGYNFVAGLLLTFLLGNYIPKINDFLNSIKWNFEIIGTNFTFLNIAIPFLLATLSRIIKLHDKVSDVFRIRIKYDVETILKPLANAVAFKSDDLEKFLIKNRISLMKNCFYKYASTQEDKCEIEYHNVIMAIDQLSWYWTVIEILVLTGLGTIISLLYNSKLFIVLIIVFSLLLVINRYILKICKKYTTIEVENILENQERKNHIMNSFNAI
jgi:hypothetical protein